MLENQVSVDAREQRLFELEAMKSSITAEQAGILRELDTEQVALADGCRSMADWVAARLDIGPETARKLVRTARRLEDLPYLSQRLGAGLASFDRINELAQLSTSESEEEVFEESRMWDISGLRRQVADQRRLSADEEQKLFEDRFFVMQPNLSESWFRMWGGLPGAEGAIVEKALLARADTFPRLPDGSRPHRATSNADALVSIAEDSLTGGVASDGTDRATSTITVFVDAGEASKTSGETGVRIEAGPRVGPQTLAGLLCGGQVEVTALNEDGVPLGVGDKTYAIPPRLRRAVIYRDGGCVVDGCASRYRLQAHHDPPFPQGKTEASDLRTFCWYHHQVVIHRLGYRIDPDTPRTRIRFLRSNSRGPP